MGHIVQVGYELKMTVATRKTLVSGRPVIRL